MGGSLYLISPFYLIPPLQVTYSPRVLSGCGLTDGEAMGRLRSYLRRFGKSTREMRRSHRIDVITLALLHYASRVRLNIGKYSIASTFGKRYSPKEVFFCASLVHNLWVLINKICQTVDVLYTV